MKKVNKVLLHIGMVAVVASGVSCYAGENNASAGKMFNKLTEVQQRTIVNHIVKQNLPEVIYQLLKCAPPEVQGNILEGYKPMIEKMLSESVPNLAEDLMKELSISDWKDSQEVKDLKDAISANDRGKVEGIVNVMRQKDNASMQYVLNMAIFDATAECNLSRVVFLVELGADVNALHFMYMTPLHLAALRNAKDIVNFLIDKGANINATNSFGDTPLHRAALTNSVESARILFDRGANINARNGDNKTPLRIAIDEHNNEVADFLRSKGAQE